MPDTDTPGPYKNELERQLAYSMVANHGNPSEILDVLPQAVIDHLRRGPLTDDNLLPVLNYHVGATLSLAHACLIKLIQDRLPDDDTMNQLAYGWFTLKGFVVAALRTVPPHASVIKQLVDDPLRSANVARLRASLEQGLEAFTKYAIMKGEPFVPYFRSSGIDATSVNDLMRDFDARLAAYRLDAELDKANVGTFR